MPYFFRKKPSLQGPDVIPGVRFSRKNRHVDVERIARLEALNASMLEAVKKQEQEEAEARERKQAADAKVMADLKERIERREMDRASRFGNKPRPVYVKREKRNFLDMPQAPVDDLDPYEGLGYVRRGK